MSQLSSCAQKISKGHPFLTLPPPLLKPDMVYANYIFKGLLLQVKVSLRMQWLPKFDVVI